MWSSIRCEELERKQLRKLEVHLLIVAVNGYLQVGDEYTEPCVRNLAENGRYLVVGFAAGDIPAVPANLVLMRCATETHAHQMPLQAK